MNNNVNNKQSMNTDELYLLVATELSDTLTAEETKRLEEWKAAAPANKSLYEKLVRIWEATPDVDSLAVYDREKAFELFLARVAEAKSENDGSEQGAGDEADAQKETARPFSIVGAVRRRVVKALRYAAVVAVVVSACSYLFYKMGQDNIEKAFAQIVVEAPEGATSKVTLPDGTSVWLNAGSRIAYSQGFGVKDRNLTLTGEGYFEVHKNREMPFDVKSGSLSVRVLGTKFDFRDYSEDPTAMVSLDEGSVALGVVGKTHDAGCKLVPSQRAVFDKKGGNLTVENYDARTACLWTDGTIMLNGRCLADIAKDLSRTYATNIVIADTALAKVRFYGVFHRKDQDLPQILNVLAGTGRIKYAIKGNEVKIY